MLRNILTYTIVLEYKHICHVLHYMSRIVYIDNSILLCIYIETHSIMRGIQFQMFSLVNKLDLNCSCACNKPKINVNQKNILPYKCVYK